MFGNAWATAAPLIHYKSSSAHAPCGLSVAIGFRLLKPVHGTCPLNPAAADTGPVAKACSHMSG